MVNILDYNNWMAYPSELEIINMKNGAIVMVLVPHENEPLGTLILNSAFQEQHNIEDVPIAYCTNLDIPPVVHRFSIPVDFEHFFYKFHLKPLKEQLEFSYTDSPLSPVEYRAAQFYEYAQHAQLTISLHNDPIRNYFYVYTHQNDSILNSVIKNVNNTLLGVNESLSKVDYTDKLNDYIYQYFPLSNILPSNQNECFGIYFKERCKKVISVEIPMFEWSTLDKKTAELYRNLYLFSVSEGLRPEERKMLLKKNQLTIPSIPMIPLNKLTQGLNEIVTTIIHLHKEGE